MDSTEVLNHQQIEDKIKRIAWQIYEEHHNETEVLLVGIAKRGYALAQRIYEALNEIANLNIKLIALKLDKTQLLKGEMHLEPAQEDLSEKNVVVVDDVLNSGATLIYGVKYFLDFPVKRINTAVLVDRNHKHFPVKADYKGLSLSTSLKQHVDVQIEESPFSVRISYAQG
jgi:pyrimidine operon attenuation protein/uracil phosphoribosyltransferase